MSMMLLDSTCFLGIFRKNWVYLRKQALCCMVIKPANNSGTFDEPRKLLATSLQAYADDDECGLVLKNRIDIPDVRKQRVICARLLRRI